MYLRAISEVYQIYEKYIRGMPPSLLFPLFFCWFSLRIVLLPLVETLSELDKLCSSVFCSEPRSTLCSKCNRFQFRHFVARGVQGGFLIGCMFFDKTNHAFIIPCARPSAKCQILHLMITAGLLVLLLSRFSRQQPHGAARWSHSPSS